MADRERLEIEIEASGMVSGRAVAVRELGEIKKAAGQTGEQISKFEQYSANATRGLGGVVSSARALFSTVAASGVLLAFQAALRDISKAAMEAEVSQVRLDLAVKNRGVGIGITTQQLQRQASALQEVTRFEDDAIMKAQSVLLRFNSIDGSNIDRVTKLTLDFAEATGRDAAGAAIALGRALDQPGEGMRALAEAGIILEPRQEKFLRYLNETGKEAKAQEFILEQLESKMKDFAVTMGDTAVGAVAKFRNALGDLKEEIGRDLPGVWENLVNGATMAVNRFRDLIKEDDPSNPGALSKAKLEQDLARLALQGRKAGGGLLAFADDGPKWLTPEEQRKKEEAARKVAAALEAIREAAERVLDKLDPVAAINRQFKEDASALEKYYRNIAGGAEQYADALERLNQRRREDLGITQQMIPLLEIESRLAASLRGQSQDYSFVGPPEPAKVREGYGAGGTLTITVNDDTLERTIQSAFEYAGEGFLQSWGAAVANTVYAAFNGGDVVDAFVDTLEQGLVGTLAKLFNDLAVAFGKELVKQLAAAKGVDAVDSGGNITGGGWMSALSVAWPVLAIAAVGVAAKYFATRNDGERWTSSAGVAMTETAGLKGGYGSILGTSNSQTQKAVEDAIIALLRSFESATGSFIVGMETISVEIRHDKKAFRVGEMLYATIEEAIVAAAKQAFLSADLSRELDPIMRRYIEGFNLGDPEKFQQGMALIGSILDEFSGLSDIELTLQNLPQQIAAVKAQLLDFGASLADSELLSMKFGVNSLRGVRQSIIGEELSPKEDLELRKQQAVMFNAQVALMRAEIQAKILFLQKEIELAQWEWGGGGGGTGGGGGFRNQMLRSKVAYVQVEAKVGQASLDVNDQYLNGRVEQVNKEREILQAQLDAWNELYKTLDGLEIDIGKLKLRGVGNSFGGAVDKFAQIAERWDRGVEAFRQAIHDSKYNTATTPLSERDRLAGIYNDFRGLLVQKAAGNVNALEALPGVYNELLALSKSYSGGGTGLGFLGLGDSYAQFFDAIYGLAGDSAALGRPKRITDGPVVYDERLYKAQISHLTVATKHQSVDQQQTSTLITQQKTSLSLEKAILDELKKWNSTASKTQMAG